MDASIGRRILERRNALGLAASDLAETLRITADTLLDYEIGRTRVPAGLLCDIARALDCPIGHFFDNLDILGDSPPGDQGGDAADGDRFGRILSRIDDPSEREFVMRLAGGFASRRNGTVN